MTIEITDVSRRWGISLCASPFYFFLQSSPEDIYLWILEREEARKEGGEEGREWERETLKY